MRRAYILLIGFLCAAILAACAAPQSPVPVADSFSCRFSADYGDITAAGVIERTPDKVLTITFDAPASLSGITLVWDGEQVRMRVFGIETALPQSYLPQQALGSVVGDALDDAVTRAREGNLSEERLLFSGTVGEYDYTLRCDSQSGVPAQLDVPALPLRLTFSDFEIH